MCPLSFGAHSGTGGLCGKLGNAKGRFGLRETGRRACIRRGVTESGGAPASGAGRAARPHWIFTPALAATLRQICCSDRISWPQRLRPRRAKRLATDPAGTALPRAAALTSAFVMAPWRGGAHRIRAGARPASACARRCRCHWRRSGLRWQRPSDRVARPRSSSPAGSR